MRASERTRFAVTSITDMGGLFRTLFGGLFGAFQSDTASKIVEVALEKTEDVDKRNALALEFFKQREETRRAELTRVTVPWVDAIHKMGRQLFWLAMGVGALVLIGMGKGAELQQHAELLFAVLGGGGLYTVMKGRGR